MMKSSGDKYETNPSKTIVLWKNNVATQAIKDNTTKVPSFDIRQQLNRNGHKVPRGLSENYLYFIRKSADELVNRVIVDSVWVARCSFKSYK